MKFIGMKQLVKKKLQIYFKNYDFCDYVEFGAIFAITAWVEVQI